MPSLSPWKDISPEGTPLQSPAPNAAHILIIGGGIIGLTTAWVLLDRGYRVTIVSKEWASYSEKQRLTSQIAGALWEFPPAVCGHHTDAISLVHSKRWCMVSYHIWNAIADSPSLSVAAGVQMKPATFFTTQPIAETPALLQKIHEMRAGGVRGVIHGTDLIRKYGINPAYGIVDAFEFLAPVIDTDTSMAWLTKLVAEKGATLKTQAITGDLFAQASHIREHYNADAIVNATGLGAYTLADDKTCYSMRGGLIRLINDGSDFPKITTAMAVPADTGSAGDSAFPSNEIVFLVPRNDNILILGGITEPHEWDLDLSLDSPIIKRMRARCELFLPALKNARVDAEYPFAQGLRPFRGRNVRVERELRVHGETGKPSRIVHSYGHGGAGWSLSFGCASDVLKLVEEALLDLDPVSMDAGVLRASL